ncbi:MAG TPA: CpsD/CapB family tyrosine-protein kinase [Anaerolineales bacterium]|nr:CpsD/CapB family tyrosine-protein kinase [Anaerolineales bacterium]HRF46496.1 CpsD/CapB family tyrosine-protein kinase [Anaerolineales bacterium]
MTPSLLTLSHPNSPAAEAFRTLRSNLIFAGLEKPLQTLVVTSASADDGKSVALANLAVVMAQGGRRTILVDCDLRKPRQHALFGVPNVAGFSDWMTEASPAAPALTTIPEVPGLQLLPAGTATANPADLLTSPRIRDLIVGLKSQADFVLFDAAPLLAVSDAALLAANLDGAVLVVASGQARRDDVQRAREMLEKIRVRVVGAILTNAPQE